MFANLFFNGVPVSITVEPTEPCAPTSVQGQIKALTNFTNHVSGKSVQQDVKDSARSIKLSGSEK